jgi:dTDP-4-amino-4,6-dideoxygalactose transaminase
MVREFEAIVARRLGVKHCVAVCNGQTGLEIAARALGLTGEVIVPSYTFIATAHALLWQGITPVFADIDAQTHNLDPAAVEKAITARTTGIVGVHLWGRPAPVEALQALASAHGLQLMFDAAHAFGNTHSGRPIGGFGRCEVFSFHATKFVNCGEGGAITTNDDALAAKIRLMKNFGFAGYDNVIRIGTNGKMSELNAAMGLTNLEAMGRFVEANRRNHAAYERELRDVPGLEVVRYDEREACNRQYVVVEVDRASGCDRDQLVNALHAENVLARKYFWPGCHRMRPYRDLFPDAGGVLPATETVAARVVVLPTGESVSADDVKAICGLIRHVVTSGERRLN